MSLPFSASSRCHYAGTDGRGQVTTAAMSSAWQQADGFIRYVVAGDDTFNTISLNVASGSGLASRFGVISSLEPNISDISAFMN
ncbi:MAG: hypothetical protein EOP21_05295 [Hyphomicrobiales bacterium]|nr:MAG: hypothetical protein EOP21_05295 [Hyphomicrobiales bacterium]